LSVEAVAKRLLMPKSTLASWVTASRAGKLIDIGKAQRPLTEFELELAKVKRELTEVKMERDLLKKRQRTLSRKYAMMEQLREDCPVSLMCRIYHFSQSGYYAWQGRPPAKRAQENA